ncbi:MAG TPA: hypothetical protein DDZ83_13120 [Nitrospinae bacterium]|nr:hypothetical protein [Nitrospinota bacterium]
MDSTRRYLKKLLFLIFNREEFLRQNRLSGKFKFDGRRIRERITTSGLSSKSKGNWMRLPDAIAAPWKSTPNSKRHTTISG